MITNERQFRITRTEAAKFEKALAQLEKQADTPSRISPLLRKAERDALASQIKSLRGEIREYESLRKGGYRVFEGASFEELPRLLIQARIARGMTQRDLAERLLVREQQIQRYEATEYASASLSRVREVIEALDIEVSETVSLEKKA